MAQDSIRVLGVDIDLDKNAAICSVLEIDANGHTVEVARHFIKQSALVKRRKRDYNADCKKDESGWNYSQGILSKMVGASQQS